MMITPAEEENNVEVRREDQTNINKFARLNARLHELRDERKVIKVSLVDSMREVLSIIFRYQDSFHVHSIHSLSSGCVQLVCDLFKQNTSWYQRNTL